MNQHVNPVDLNHVRLMQFYRLLAAIRSAVVKIDLLHGLHVSQDLFTADYRRNTARELRLLADQLEAME